MKNKVFTEALLKGRIGEYIFSSMLSESKNFSVIPFGHEYVFPSLLQHSSQPDLKRLMKFIRKAPDFAVINQIEKKVYLVEVKYQRRLDERRCYGIAKQLTNDWDPSWLFVCTRSGFFFSSCQDIVKNFGRMSRLTEQWVNDKLQREYLVLLNKSILDHSQSSVDSE